MGVYDRLRSAAARLGASAGVLLILSAPWAAASAADVLGLYGGAAVGEGRVEASGFANPAPASVPSLQSLAKNHSAYQLMLGIRPIEPIGVEVDYLDLGRATGSLGSSDSLPLGYTSAADVRTTGVAAFGVLYLLPVPILDLYAKLGVARLRTSGDATVQLTGTVLCPATATPCRYSSAYRATDTSFAAGVGAQVKFGPLALRAEYERFRAAGEYPSLATVGVTWTFL